MGGLKIDSAEIARVLQELVAIPSVNPAFGGSGEAGVAAFVKNYLIKLDIPYIEQQVEPGRSNVIGMLQGESSGPALLLEAHMDTVQTTGMTIPPFSGTISEGRLYGRGACDTKGSLAAMLVAIGTLKRSGLKLPTGVHLAAVVDEEFRYAGVSALATAISAGELQYSGAIVGEPTNLHQVIAHKGCVRFYITAHGKPGHSSEPAKGINAIEQMMEVIRCLKEEIEPSFELKRHPLLGPPTHCISEITGGLAPNTIPGSCRITLDRRTLPGEEPLEVWAGYREHLSHLKEVTPGLSLTIEEPFIIDYALETAASHPLPQKLGTAVAGYAGERRILGATYGTDASKLARAGVPAVVFGPGDIAQAHTDDEWIELREVEAAAAALVDLIVHFEREGQ
ncbi:acetylornithine deacetylase [Paenibacillus sp. PK3_47]|uniref:M20 family metallopeptidase n=1 Tax=Paenibacillus sp. PK3_47 TaxID=2072642 RepID=UPI00201D88C2|nr:M20 family metallopeptidase [Paenibacillus sp. PK3_47]UQZ36895.1 acetylornithine deacetylase [Paenibacillus sp. PK3_47]